MIDHFLGNNIWSNVVILAMGLRHSVEVRCQGATAAADQLPNRPKIDWSGRLISYELGRTSTEEQAQESIQNVLNTLTAKTVRSCNLILVDFNFSRLNFLMTTLRARGAVRRVTCAS